MRKGLFIGVALAFVLVLIMGGRPAKASELGTQPNHHALASSEFRIDIPSISLNLPIVTAYRRGISWDFRPITNTAAYLEGLPLPDQGGNLVIGAHSEFAGRQPGPFYSLNRVKPDDEITVNYNGNVYRYKVQKSWLVPFTDTRPIARTSESVLTLLTCDGYNPQTGGYDLRLIVRAVRI